METFLEWLNEGLYTGINGLPGGTQRMLLNRLLRQGMDNPEMMRDNDIYQVTHLFQMLTGRNPTKEAGSPFGPDRAGFFRRLYDLFKASQPAVTY